MPYRDGRTCWGCPRGAGRCDRQRDQRGRHFNVCVDITHSQIGQGAQFILPAVVSGEMNLTSMSGERRLRLVEKSLGAPGSAKPDCIIAARLANHLESLLREEGRAEYADQFM